MRTLRSLVENNSQVWIFCRNDGLQADFLEQAENEGFIALNGVKPHNLCHRSLYGINDDITMGYLAAMIWVLSAKADKYKDHHVRVDYERYIAGEDDYLYRGRLDDLPDRSEWERLAYSITDKDEFDRICDASSENLTYEEYKAYIYRWLINSTWHYKPESAFERIYVDLWYIAKCYSEKMSVSDCAVEVGYSCG